MDYVNSIRLVGRVAAVGEPRELPSGDVVVTMRVVVPREGPGRRPRGSVEAVRPGAGVDTIDVACWTAAVRRSAARCAVDDHIEVEGALRRRFFGVAGGRASRYEVEAGRVRRVSGGRRSGT